MDNKSLKNSIENYILENDLDERFCQLYESIINEINSKKYIIRLSHKLSPVNTPILIISLKRKRNRPTILISIINNSISLKFMLKEFLDVPLNRINSLIEDCYYNHNKSKMNNYA